MTASKLQATPLDAAQLAEMTALQIARGGQTDGVFARTLPQATRRTQLLTRLHQSGLLDRVDGRWALSAKGTAALDALEAMWAPAKRRAGSR